MFITESGFETCFGRDLRHPMYWDRIAKRISNPDVAPFETNRRKGFADES